MEVFIDGACSSNGNDDKAKAGYGVYWGPDNPNNLSQRIPVQERETNNRAEQRAAIVTIQQAIKMEIPKVTIKSDSNIVVKGITNWIKNWKTNGWENASKDPVANKDLWVLLDQLATEYTEKGTLEWEHIYLRMQGYKVTKWLIN